jgi:hypothetical protein
VLSEKALEFGDGDQPRPPGSLDGLHSEHVPASPTSAATTCATPARPCCCMRAAPRTRSPSPRPRRSRLHRPHLRAPHARRTASPARPDHAGDQDSNATPPGVDPGRPSSTERRSSRSRRSGKDLQIERADARTRTGDPFITRRGRAQIVTASTYPSVPSCRKSRRQWTDGTVRGCAQKNRQMLSRCCSLSLSVGTTRLPLRVESGLGVGDPLRREGVDHVAPHAQRLLRGRRSGAGLGEFRRPRDPARPRRMPDLTAERRKMTEGDKTRSASANYELTATGAELAHCGASGWRRRD